jgi:vancomycin resistance protein YoaR
MALPTAEKPVNKRSTIDGKRAIERLNAAADKRQGRKRSKHAGPGTAPGKTQRLFNSPARARVGVAVLLVIIIVGGFSAVDGIASLGRIHRGVTVAGIDVGGMSTAAAAALIETELTAAAAAPIDLFADEDAAQKGASDTAPILDAIASYQSGSQPASTRSWRITTSSLGAYVDGEGLAQQAYAVGRGLDFLPSRLVANIQGVALDAHLVYDTAQLAALEDVLTQSTGNPMRNAGIRFDNGVFVAEDGEDGYVVEHTVFVEQLDRAFLTSTRSLVVPMESTEKAVGLAQAQELARMVQECIAQPIVLAYGKDLWELSGNKLGPWVGTSVEQDGTGYRLTAHIDPEKLKDGLGQVVGDINPGIPARDASFKVTGGQVAVVPSAAGEGIDFKRLAADLDGILFSGTPAERTVSLTIGTLEPEVTTADAEAMHITQKIATYTTSYSGTSAATVANIQLAADLINGSLIAPQQVWSFNGTTGECTAARGFQESKAIYGDELVDEIGGGICQVATTIFNAVFESGYPIAERYNHSQYLAKYPDGRDAAVSWPGLDFKFQNDTKDWVLLILSYDDTGITATLWGTSPGYTVGQQVSDWATGDKYPTKKVDDPEMLEGQTRVETKGEDGKIIYVTRYVYNASGDLLREGKLRSAYEPVTEVIRVGTKKDPNEQPAASPPPAADPQPPAPSPETQAPDPTPAG